MGDKSKVDELNLNDEELDENEVEEEGGEVKAGGKKIITPGLVKIILGIVGVIILIAISATVSYMVTKKMVEKPQITGEENIFKPVAPALNTFTLDEFTINTSDPEPHIINIELALGYDKTNQLIATEIGERIAQIRDIINTILASKYYRDLATPEGKENLKLEIKNEINNILTNGKIKDVYFLKFILQ